MVNLTYLPLWCGQMADSENQDLAKVCPDRQGKGVDLLVSLGMLEKSVRSLEPIVRKLDKRQDIQDGRIDRLENKFAPIEKALVGIKDSVDENNKRLGPVVKKLDAYEKIQYRVFKYSFYILMLSLAGSMVYFTFGYKALKIATKFFTGADLP